PIVTMVFEKTAPSQFGRRSAGDRDGLATTAARTTDRAPNEASTPSEPVPRTKPIARQVAGTGLPSGPRRGKRAAREDANRYRLNGTRVSPNEATDSPRSFLRTKPTVRQVT